MKRQIGIKLDEETIARVDSEAGRRGLTRTGFIEAAISLSLDGTPISQARAAKPATNVLSSADAKKGLKPILRGGKK